MKKIVIAAWRGVRLSAVLFLLSCIVNGLVVGTENFASGYGMARDGAAVILIGLGFGIPLLIYETELRSWIKILIHMGTGCIVMIGASVFGGWLPVDKGLPAVLIVSAFQVVVAFAIWGCYFLSALIEAKKMNRKIKEKQRSE